MTRRTLQLAMMLGFALGAAVVPAWAGIDQVAMFRNLEYLQTGNGNAVTFDSAFFTLQLRATAANEYPIVRAFYGGPASPVNLNPVDPLNYEFDSGFYTSQVMMDTDFPKGTYTLTANNIATSDSATTAYSYASDAYVKALPYLTGTNYADLQGMNPGAAFGFQFSPYIKDATATDPLLFFTLFDAGTGAVVFASILQPTDTGVTLPAGTLLPTHDYVYDLDYSDRVSVASPGAANAAILGFDTRTDGYFTTGVPEPAAAGVLTLAGVMLTGRQRRWR